MKNVLFLSVFAILLSSKSVFAQICGKFCPPPPPSSVSAQVCSPYETIESNISKISYNITNNVNSTGCDLNKDGVNNNIDKEIYSKFKAAKDSVSQIYQATDGNYLKDQVNTAICGKFGC